jgi:hypothetical protein
MSPLRRAGNRLKRFRLGVNAGCCIARASAWSTGIVSCFISSSRYSTMVCGNIVLHEPPAVEPWRPQSALCSFGPCARNPCSCADFAITRQMFAQRSTLLVAGSRQETACTNGIMYIGRRDVTGSIWVVSSATDDVDVVEVDGPHGETMTLVIFSSVLIRGRRIRPVKRPAPAWVVAVLRSPSA